MPYIAEVILPVYLKNVFQYAVNDEDIVLLNIGKRVVVPFGKNNKLYTAMVYKIYETQENTQTLKSIHEIIDEIPIINPIQLAFWTWIADYYWCSLGEVMLFALPNHLILHTHTNVIFTEAIQSLDITTLTTKENEIIHFLAKHAPYSFKKLKNEFSEYTIKKLLKKKIIQLDTQLINPFKPHLKTFIFLDWQNLINQFQNNQQVTPSEVISLAIQNTKSENQQKVLLYLLQNEGIEKKYLLHNLQISDSVLKALEKKKWIYQEKHAVDRIQLKKKGKQNVELNSHELEFCNQFIQELLNSTSWSPTVFFHDLGMKRIVFFIEYFKKIISMGKQILFLVPEIAFTDKFVEELYHYFTEELGIYHSRINDNERVEIWYKVFIKEYKIIIGVRSALFLPFTDLGLILVDEEQDANYKQEEKNPKLNIKDAAIYYAKMLNIPIILSTQTPSIETYYHTQQHKYRLVNYLRSPAPKENQIQITDLKTQISLRQSIGLLTDLSYKSIYEQKLKNHISVIFLNRKGYAPRIVCNTCGHVHFCIHCDIALTYYKQSNKLKCHYCGYQEDNIYFCKNCGSNDLSFEGFGTEKIEEQLHTIFPNFVIRRLDSSNFKTKKQLADFLNELHKNNTDIIVGTQLITKLLHFDNVDLIIVLMLDMMLHIPNFRAFEYTYQFLRHIIYELDIPHNPSKKLIIQTRMPNHKIFEFLMKDYASYYHEQILLREELRYPPFSRLIELEILHPKLDVLNQAIHHFNKLLRSAYSEWILGPTYPYVAKLKNYYRIQYLIKIPKKQNSLKVKEHIQKAFNDFLHIERGSHFRLNINVDPK